MPLDRVWFCRSWILTQGINRPNAVITIDTGYQIGLMWSSPLTQGIKIGLLGYGGLLRLSQGHIPIVFYDRPAIQAEACQLVSSASEVCNIATGYALSVFSKVYCDRVYFSCAERIMTGSGFDPPPPSGTPYPVEKSSAPPPPPRGWIHPLVMVSMPWQVCDTSNLSEWRKVGEFAMKLSNWLVWFGWFGFISV